MKKRKDLERSHRILLYIVNRVNQVLASNNEKAKEIEANEELSKEVKDAQIQMLNDINNLILSLMPPKKEGKKKPTILTKV